jgi:hypothetical protein
MTTWCVSDPLPAASRPALPLFQGESCYWGNADELKHAPGFLFLTLPLIEGESRAAKRTRQGVAHTP